MPGIMGELGEEGPLGAAAAFAERVEGVYVSEESGHRGGERVASRPRNRSATASRPNTSAA
jgi:hypothetical protein